MINGAHVVVTSTDPEAEHALLRDVFKLAHVNDGGYIIFGLPPADVGSPRRDQQRPPALPHLGSGLVTEMTLHGGGKLNVYEPRHARPKH
jgi:hypothetical protein